eukprot:GHVR01069091.1.p2 GENE.GHVR01069091.1~~GHVR01069091.1.p2  ORF type:complete len:215 (-),score=65.35 GHVR01069091.1:96-740(-)
MSSYPELEKNINESNKEEIIHIVSNADTLTNIAMRYGCSVEAIKSRNSIVSNDIFMLSTIVIPSCNYTYGYLNKLPDDVEDAARISGHVQAIVIATGCDEEIARQALESRNFDFARALAEISHVKTLSERYQVDEREVLAYLDICEFNYEKTKKMLEEDLLWERDLPRGKDCGKITKFSVKTGDTHTHTHTHTHTQKASLLGGAMNQEVIKKLK